MTGRGRRRVRLGPGAVVEPGATVGYAPGRRIADLSLTIGAGSRIRTGSVVYLGSKIGAGFETGHGTVIREENEIGDRVQVWSHSVLDYGCTIGREVHIHTGVYVAQYSRIGDGVFIGPGAILLNDPHPGCSFSRQCMRGPTVGRNAVIGGGAVLLPMITIGEGAVIGGGAVVTKDVPAGVVVRGNPARVHGRREDLRCWTGHTLKPYGPLGGARPRPGPSRS